MMAEIAPLRAKLGVTVVGTTKTPLLQSRTEESNIGNFVADAMVSSWKGKRMPNGGKVRYVWFRPDLFSQIIDISVLDFAILELYGPT